MGAGKAPATGEMQLPGSEPAAGRQAQAAAAGGRQPPLSCPTAARKRDPTRGGRRLGTQRRRLCAPAWGRRGRPSSPEMISPDNHAKGLVCMVMPAVYIRTGGLGGTRAGGSRATGSRGRGCGGECVWLARAPVIGFGSGVLLLLHGAAAATCAQTAARGSVEAWGTLIPVHLAGDHVARAGARSGGAEFPECQ